MGSKYLSLIKEAIKKTTVQTEVDVLGVTYTLNPPSTRDEFILAESMTNLGSNPEEIMTALQSVRARTLASMITAINGEEIPEQVDIGSGNTMERVLYLAEDISQWPSIVVNTLYTVATDFKQKYRKEVQDSVKYEWYGENLLLREQKEEEDVARMDELEENRKVDFQEIKDTPETSPGTSSFEEPVP